MQSKIRILPEHTINQIKAGEVIENPASVVKELTENAIDAGASHITIEIVSGGRNLIRITDNGSGMNRDDAILSLERHATSKIKNAEDLETILTMGFRGEAVPSIASISKFSILTRVEEEEMGTLLMVDGGKLITVDSAARAPGTTIEVKSLFFNVPVRKKFQRSPTSDTNDILKAVTLLALSHREIQFELISNEKKILSVKKEPIEKPLEGLKNRILALFGEDFAMSLKEVSFEKDDFSLSGFIGLPSVTRQNRTGQYLFINNRAVQNPLLSYAVRDGYGTALPQNRHPIYVLQFKLPGDLVDINVHPQKREVRLRQEGDLRELTRKATEKTLQTSGYLFPEREENPFHSFTFTAPPSPFSFTQEAVFKCEPKWEPKFQEEELPLPDFFFQKEEEKSEVQSSIRPLATIPHYIIVDPASLNASFDEKKREAPLILIDQKRAHARIIFENFDRSAPISIHQLLIPHHFEVTSIEEGALLEELVTLKKMGIEIDQIGPKLFSISSLPDFLEVDALMSFIKDFLGEMKEGSTLQKEKEKQLALLAVRHAISLKKSLSIEEALNVTKKLMQCQMPFQDPKGNETFAFIKHEELKNFFK